MELVDIRHLKCRELFCSCGFDSHPRHMSISGTISRGVYNNIFKPYFFSKDPEFVHDEITKIAKLLGSSHLARSVIKHFYSFEDPTLEQEYWGIKFINPIGLPAGFDKNAESYKVMGPLGFGYCDVGTVTFEPYAGNPKPRLVRLPKSEAILVNYGLKNDGAKVVVDRLKQHKTDIPLVVSIGKTNSPKTVDRDLGILDYYNCLKFFVEADLGDIYEINISCPNTFGGEPFTNKDDLELLLEKLYSLPITKPVFIKMPIELDTQNMEELLSICLNFKVEAVILGNLRKQKRGDGVIDNFDPNLSGGLSGKPTEKISNERISEAYKYCGDKLKIIGVGGIFSAADAYKKICLGASLVGLISGLIYEGPQLVSEINRGLVYYLKRDGFKNISQAIGSAYK